MVGITVASPARLTPLMRFSRKVAPTTMAPVEPPLTKASPFPSFTRLKAAAMEQSAFSLRMEVGSSSMVMTPGA